MELSDLQTIAVTGMGTMGRGIAQCLAAAGYAVRCHDVEPRALDRSLACIESVQNTLVSTGMLSADAAACSLRRIRLCRALPDCVEGAQLVVEAVPEIIDLKLSLYGTLDQLCAPEAVLATNTSGLSITRIASATRRPDKVAGFHWWNPAHLMPLVEVTKGDQTSDETADLLMALSRRLGKRPILVRRDVPGFVGNRLQFALLREALHLVEEGIASPEDVDTAVKAGPGLRYAFLGPFETADLGGLDVFTHISSYLFAQLSAEKRPPGCLSDRAAQGRLGVKSGEGFYDYSGRTLDELLAARDAQLIRLLKALSTAGPADGTE